MNIKLETGIENTIAARVLNQKSLEQIKIEIAKTLFNEIGSVFEILLDRNQIFEKRPGRMV